MKKTHQKSFNGLISRDTRVPELENISHGLSKVQDTRPLTERNSPSKSILMLFGNRKQRKK